MPQAGERVPGTRGKASRRPPSLRRSELVQVAELGQQPPDDGEDDDGERERDHE